MTSLEIDFKRSHHIDVWCDTFSDLNPMFRISLCHQSNEEIRCIAICSDEESLLCIANLLSEKYSLPVRRRQ